MKLIEQNKILFFIIGFFLLIGCKKDKDSTLRIDSDVFRSFFEFSNLPRN